MMIAIPNNSAHWTPRRRELLDWFRKNAKPLAEAYEGAILLLNDKTFPGRIHFIAHAVRDIADRLASVLDSQLARSQVQYKNEMDQIEKQWPNLDLLKDRKDKKGMPEKVTIDYRLASMIDSLVAEHRKRQKAPSNYESLFHFLMRREPSKANVNQRIVNDFKEMRDWFMDFAHLRAKEPPSVDESELQRQFEKFEGMLHSFVGNFFTGVKGLDEILRKANQQPYSKPTDEQIDTAIPFLSSPQHETYFFLQLENPEWIIPLKKKNIFAYPPTVISWDDGTTQFPHWPESKYLVKMAPNAPSEVAELYAEFNTDNSSIVGDIVDAALGMSPKVAVMLIPAICRAAQNGTLWIHFKDASDLCVRLADGGEVRAAMTLAEALFAPKFEEGQELPTRRDVHWYKHGLGQVVPALAEKEPRQFLLKLCNWLNASVKAKKPSDPESGGDYSYTWRPAIEEHPENRDYDFAGVMVGFVREAFERAIQSSSISMEEALQILDRYQFLIFRRIRLHLINEFAESSIELARRTIMNRELFDDFRYKHEYARLVENRLNMLSPEEHKTWFSWIDEGPNMSDFDTYIKEHFGRDATDEDRQKRICYWKFEKLHCVQEHLTDEWKSFYKDMRAKYGEPELADLNIRTTSTWGHDSPMTVEDLAQMSFEQVVEKVSTWQPDKPQFMGPDIGGLASTFEKYLAKDPELFSLQASFLVKKPAIYVRGFVAQMSKAVKAGSSINLKEVLKLCNWVIERPIEEQTTLKEDFDALVDRDWQWTREEISRFIENICKAKTDDVPKYPMCEFREPIWHVLEVLCRDQSKSHVVHDISQDDPRLKDYLNLGINSPRGKAIEAAFEYARWVGEHIKKRNGNQDVIPGGFNTMPEVRKMLEWQLASENRSIEALSIIGARVGLVHWIDKEWLEKNASNLFYLEGIEQEPPVTKGWAAWNAFLVWVRPHVEFYKLFRNQFAYAVVQAAKVNMENDSFNQPVFRLGEHLMLLYGRGQLGLDDDNALLRRFIDTSKPAIRRHSIGFVGRCLGDDSSEKIPTQILKRFMTLWEVYWASVGKDDAKQKPGAWLFGPWFSSGQLPAQWALEQLEQFVAVDPIPEPDHTIVKQLRKIAHIDIARTVRILDIMIHGDREGWRIHGWLDSARQILETAMKAGGDARSQAEKVIDYLGRRGHTSFGELLDI